MIRTTIPACCIAIVLLFAQTPESPQVDDVVRAINDVSVSVLADDGSEGSGVVVVRDGIVWVWTAGHVVESLRENDGSFRRAFVAKQLTADDSPVAVVQFSATVLIHSSEHDLALLRIGRCNFISRSAKFAKSDVVVPNGTELFHVGSFFGVLFGNSLSSGIMSYRGRMYAGIEYDQTTCTNMPGSSGGGVFTRDGRCIGIISKSAGYTVNLVIPVRRMRQWAKDAGVEWAINDESEHKTNE